VSQFKAEMEQDLVVEDAAGLEDREGLLEVLAA
jgi:hypothetical protein